MKNKAGAVFVTAEEAAQEQELQRIKGIMAEVQFPGYDFEVGVLANHYSIRVRYIEADVDTGKEEVQLGRLWVFPAGQKTDQIVQTAFKALMTSYEHRIREHFLFRGTQVMGPHRDLDVLATLLPQRTLGKSISF